MIKPMSRELLERVVDAVAEVLGVDTGTISETRFKTAIEAAEIALGYRRTPTEDPREARRLASLLREDRTGASTPPLTRGS